METRKKSFAITIFVTSSNKTKHGMVLGNSDEYWIMRRFTVSTNAIWDHRGMSWLNSRQGRFRGNHFILGISMECTILILSRSPYTLMTRTYLTFGNYQWSRSMLRLTSDWYAWLNRRSLSHTDINPSTCLVYRSHGTTLKPKNLIRRTVTTYGNSLSTLNWDRLTITIHSLTRERILWLERTTRRLQFILSLPVNMMEDARLAWSLVVTLRIHLSTQSTAVLSLYEPSDCWPSFLSWTTNKCGVQTLEMHTLSHLPRKRFT